MSTPLWKWTPKVTPLITCLPHAACSRLLLSVCPFTIDDTGCPTSQSVSPSKIPPGSERSSHGPPALPERSKAKVKRVRVMAEWSAEPRRTQRHKRELRSAMKARGKETHGRGKAQLRLMKLVSAAPHAGKPHLRWRELTKRSFLLLICKGF